MATEKAPAYQWFVKDWRSSRATGRMSFAERGVYREMLDEQWEIVTLPDNAEAVADLIATTDAQRAEVLAAWPLVRRKFVTVEGGQIQNARLERCRKEFKAFVREKRKAGKARAATAVRDGNGTFQTASTPPAASQRTSSSPPAGIQPSSSSASASSSASSSASATAIATAKKEQIPREKQRGGEFDAFWAAYPNKVGKDAARKAWFKRRSDLPPVEQIVAAVERQIASARWQKDGGEFIPNPSTWLNQGRWQDEGQPASRALVSERGRQNIANAPAALALIEEDEHARG